LNVSELFVATAREIQEFIGGNEWREKMLTLPNEEEFREWEAVRMAEIMHDHFNLVPPPSLVPPLPGT
jgi:hypothetical protein